MMRKLGSNIGPLFARARLVCEEGFTVFQNCAKCHREPNDRALPRFSVGRLPCTWCAITFLCSPQRQARPSKGSILTWQTIHDQSGESTINRLSMMFSTKHAKLRSLCLKKAMKLLPFFIELVL